MAILEGRKKWDGSQISTK